ncbi:MAG: hypothetical protein WAM42_17315 [Candidatus Nitrosopolaris sp.]|jgi:hypothetical protein
MRIKNNSNFRVTDKKYITITVSCKPVILTFTLIVLLFCFNGITESAPAQLSTTAITTNNATPKNDSSNNSKCFSPLINPIRILKVNVLPPKIVMNYGGKVYQGDLSESKFRAGETISQLHIQPRNLTTNLHSKIIQVKEGSCVQFAIIGTPRLLPPSSLGVTAYDSNNGTAVKVLNAMGAHSSVFRVNLVRGTYILLAVGTWLPGSEHVSGYAIYKFVVNVIL